MQEMANYDMDASNAMLLHITWTSRVLSFYAIIMSSPGYYQQQQQQLITIYSITSIVPLDPSTRTS